MADKKYFPKVSETVYKNLVKKIFFQIDPETVHNAMTRIGEQFGKNESIKKFLSSQFRVTDQRLEQNIAGIKFDNPVGLAAGFDYEARLTQILPSIGFGFETIGTITNLECEGNPKPRLGRLPKSKSLMVNKGFRNPGAKKVIQKLFPLSFDIPIGVSIGKTNNSKINTQQKSVKDIINAFSLFEKSKINSSYYELNISCPNLQRNVNFYSSENLEELLAEVDRLRIKKPIFVKMPIDKNNRKTLEMLGTIAKHNIKGVIFGNLQGNRNDLSFKIEEVKKFKIGNFSGKPTYERSNELIKLAYRNYKDRFIIIGCGGIFSADDAYEKIKSGASLVQMITGMIFEGPQIIFQINSGLAGLLKKDKLSNVSGAIGSNAK